MKKSLLLLVLLPALLLAADAQKGHLLIIGGGARPMDVLQEFVHLCAGKPILIITSASEIPVESGTIVMRQLQQCGAGKIDMRHIVTANLANSDSIVALIDAAGGIFFTGGDQQRLMNRLGHTRTEKALNRLYYERGGIIGGTSAGAAVMSEVMITGNERVNKDSTNIFHNIQKNNIETQRGLGFLKNVIIDQHFLLRKRHNRLLSIVLEHPELPGIGIDEESAILVYPDGHFRVYGHNAVIIYDARKAKNIRSDGSGLLGAKSIRVDLLLPGDNYQIQ